MSPLPDYFSADQDYQVDQRSERQANKPRHQNARPTRVKLRPNSFNGIHRRRKKRIQW